MATKKIYVVWEGVQPGIYKDWTSCKQQVVGYKGAKYKSFGSQSEAETALAQGPPMYSSCKTKKSSVSESIDIKNATPPVWDSLAVDAACSGNPGDMEYRGVYVKTGKQVFRIGPYKRGTNNIGEFLALVHGLAYLKKNGSDLPIYSDSRIAMGWIKKKKCNTKLECTTVNAPIFDLIKRAERWLSMNTYATKIIKWDTKTWGEIPADFGRK
ncbi:MAG: ribonuclease H family protein [Massilibacteroides sp.]|nr:ribonuclease H family protein [Massilibacteroides sp.]